MNDQTEEKIEKNFERTAEEFAKRAEDWGHNVEKKWSRKESKTSEYIFSIAINIILIAIWGNLPDWFTWITDSFAAVLPLFYISFTLTIIANFAFLIFSSEGFEAFAKLILNIVSIIVMVSVYYIFPFDFTNVANYWDIAVRTILIVAIFGTAVGAIVESINILARKH